MANVPNVPGVPPLASYSGNDVLLLAADAFIADEQFASAIAPQWGIYSNNNGLLTPVITPPNVATLTLSAALAPLTLIPGLGGILPVNATFVSWEYKQDWPVSDYPVEQGAFQSYDKVQLPYDIRVTVAGGGNVIQRASFLNTILSLASNSSPGSSIQLNPSNTVVGAATTLPIYAVLTPELPFPSCTLSHVDWRRTADKGVSLIAVDLWFTQIVATTQTNFTSSPGLTNTASPTDQSQVGNGVTTPQTPNQTVQSDFAAMGGVN